jgi:hypothetical protein
VRALLEESHFSVGLTQTEVTYVSRYMSFKRCRSGECIDFGGPPTYDSRQRFRFFVVVKGHIGLHRVQGGAARLLCRKSPGDFITEMVDMSRSYTVEPSSIDSASTLGGATSPRGSKGDPAPRGSNSFYRGGPQPRVHKSRLSLSSQGRLLEVHGPSASMRIECLEECELLVMTCCQYDELIALATRWGRPEMIRNKMGQTMVDSLSRIDFLKDIPHEELV